MLCITEWRSAVRNQGLLPALDALLKRAVADPHNALCHIQRELCFQDAPRCAERILCDTTRPLEGVPLLIKDNLAQAGCPLTCASRVLFGYVSPFTATCVQRAKDAGALIVGRTNMDEFAMGSSGEHSSYGPTRNPLDPDRVPGGSSSGSAAAVAAGLVPVALGSDTGGSIRQPAACCNLTGFKPGYGKISRSGLCAFASSLDCVGLLATCVDDIALVYHSIAGPDPADPTSLLPETQAESSAPRKAIVLADTLALCEPDFADAFRQCLRLLADAGWELLECCGPDCDQALSAYLVLATAEASTNLARYDGVRYGLRAEEPEDDFAGMIRRSRGRGFGTEVRRRILLGTALLAHGYAPGYYQRALHLRERLKADYAALFAQAPLLLSPTMPALPFRLGERLEDPQRMYRADLLTVGASLAGLPAISLPTVPLRVPFRLSLQLMSARGREDTLLAAAKEVEKLFS